MNSQLALIIEDDFDASQIFAKALEVQGLTTEVIGAGDKAMERLREVTPYIIVLDLHLPNVDGTEILAWVRSMANLRETLVMVVTADARMAELLQDQADLVLLKPATFTQIRDFTARLIRRRQSVAASAPAPAPVAVSTTEATPTPAAPAPASPEPKAEPVPPPAPPPVPAKPAPVVSAAPLPVPPPVPAIKVPAPPPPAPAGPPPSMPAPKPSESVTAE